MKAQHSYDYQIKKEWSQLQKISKKKEEINNSFDEKMKLINDLRKKRYQEWLDNLLEKILAYPPFDLDLEKATPEKVFNYIVELSQKPLDKAKKETGSEQNNVKPDKPQGKSEEQDTQKNDDASTEKGDEQAKKAVEKNDVQGKPEGQNEQKAEGAEDIWSQTESF